MLKDFRQFILRGNVLDMAIGVIIGASFGKIVTSLVSDVLMPPIGLLLGKVDFSNLYINLSGREAESLAEAKKLGLATVNYGFFLNQVFDFLIVAFVVFMVLQAFQRMKAKMESAPVPTSPNTKECPQCINVIPVKATRCGFCTSAV